MVLFTIFLFPLILQTLAQCPKEEMLAPVCFCNDREEGAFMVCSKITSPEDLVPYIKETDFTDMIGLTVMDSTLMYVPGQLFKNTNYKRIMFLNSELMSLSESELAFEGLEDDLEELRVRGTDFVTTWDWNQLRNLKRIKFLEVYNITMYSLDHEFPDLKSLKTFGVVGCHISFIHEYAFRGFENIKDLMLGNNEISEIKRSMLPVPAPELFMIELNNNKLISVPEDFFTDMPSLFFVNLSGNQLITLNEDTFRSVFEKVNELYLRGNNFQCDCRMRWITDSRHPVFFEGSCTLPEKMKGMHLKYLVSKDLYCY